MPNIANPLFSMILAMDKNNGIGYQNNIPWYIPNDFRWFKQKTLGKTIVMGSQTWQSLTLKPLPNRRNIVLSRRSYLDLKITGAEVISDWKKILEIQTKEICIIGGSQIYSLFFPLVEKIYLTRINHCFSVDRYFNELDLSSFNRVFIEKIKKSTSEKYDYQFEIFHKKH